jgi:hypothetical protein
MQGTGLQGIQAPGAAAVAAPRPQPTVSGAAFGVRVAEQASAAAVRAPAGATAPGALLGLLAVQEAEGDAVRDRDARKRGRQMLDELARLQRALLSGRLDPSSLHALAALAGDPADAADPAISAVVRAVAVRARVELARLRAAATR